MNWLTIATLYGTFAGFVVGSVISALHVYGRDGDQIALCFCILGGAAFGVLSGLVIDVLAARQVWFMSRLKPARAIGILAILFIIWAIAFPAFHRAY